MVVPNREIVNTNIFSSSSAMSNPLKSNVVSEDIQMNAPRDRFTVSSMNSSRKSYMLFKLSSIVYATHIEAQSDNSNWANQTEDKLFNLSYQTFLGGDGVPNIHSQTNSSDNVPILHIGYVHTTSPTMPAINSNVSFLPYNMC